ncbi:MAG: ArsA family ATPase [Deltaproteobacteria bacterium]|nr:ArsA family ATPase [Deltaproteobacteria bacterium]
MPADAARTGRLGQLLQARQIIVVVGAGGVGKTTLSAALGVAAARQGRRALVLTVDPARRLANALGLRALDEDVQTLSIEQLRNAGCDAATPLDVAMLDVKRTFDRAVRRYASSAERAEAIMASPFYQTASTALAGSQEYMAMMRLYEVVTDGGYDVVILDTPPSAHALDFLDAPRRMIELFDSRSFRLLLRPFSAGGHVASGLFAPSSLMMRGLGRFTSVEAFHDLLGFFASFSETFDGFVDRARDVMALLRGAETSFLVISATDETSRDEGLFLASRLRDEQMEVAGWIVNRCSAADPACGADSAAIAATIAADVPEQSARTAIATAAATMAQLALADRDFATALETAIGGRCWTRRLPRRSDEPADLGELDALASMLLEPTP